MRRYVFEIPGDPIPWARAGQNGKKHFTVASRKAYMRTVREAAMVAQVRPFAGPVHVEITPIFRTPEKWTAEKRRNHVGDWADIDPSDADNLAKIILDSLQAGRRKRMGKYMLPGDPPVAYQNDKQAVFLVVKAIYGIYGRTLVTIRPALDVDLPDVAHDERAALEAAE